MGSTNAYECDGPKCAELTTREKGERYPRSWIRVTVQAPEDGESISASVHDRACLDRWLDEQLGDPALAKARGVVGTLQSGVAQ